MYIQTDYSEFFDIAYILGIPILFLIALTFWLCRIGRSFRFIVLVWSVYVFVASVGVLSLVSVIQPQRTYWFEYLAEYISTYSSVAASLNHWEIELGDPDRASDWSEPVIGDGEWGMERNQSRNR